MIKFEKIKPGMTLWECKRESSMRGKIWATWPIYIKDIDLENRRVWASWNGNPAMWIYEEKVTRYRAKRPDSKK